MIKECEFLQHWRLGWSKVPELSLSFGELFSPDGGVVRPWGLGPKLDQTLETWGLLDVHTTFDDEICLSGTRSGQGSTLWALLGGGKSDFGQRNGLKPDPQTDALPTSSRPSAHLSLPLPVFLPSIHVRFLSLVHKKRR